MALVISYYNRTPPPYASGPDPGFIVSFLASYLARAVGGSIGLLGRFLNGILGPYSRRKRFVGMAKPHFAQMEVVVDNPPDKHGFTTFTIIRNVGRAGHHYERHVKLDDLLSSPEAARILRISVRHLYRLVKEGRIKCKKQNTHLWFVSRDVQKIQLARKRISGRRETFLIN
jgi:hypothetical protein